MKTKSGLRFIGLFMITILSLGVDATGANASAGWYPTFPGDVIEVEGCLPIKQPGTVILTASSYSGRQIEIVKMINPTLQRNSYCIDEMKYGEKQGYFHFKYKWKVNLKGEYGLHLRVLKLKKSFTVWPDGVDSR